MVSICATSRWTKREFMVDSNRFCRFNRVQTKTVALKGCTK